MSTGDALLLLTGLLQTTLAFAAGIDLRRAGTRPLAGAAVVLCVLLLPLLGLALWAIARRDRQA